MTIGDKIRTLRKAKGLTQTELGNMLGVKVNAVSKWECGRVEAIPTSKIIALANIFDVAPSYLIDIDSNDTTPAVPASTGGVWVPVLGKVAAGIPIEAVENIDDYEEITAEMAAAGKHFALRIQGDSMAPRIADGDVVIVRQQTDCENNDVAVVLVDGAAATVKRIKKSSAGITLIAGNAAYEPVFYSNEDIERLPVTIVGKVVELRAKF